MEGASGGDEEKQKVGMWEGLGGRKASPLSSSYPLLSVTLGIFPPLPHHSMEPAPLDYTKQVAPTLCLPPALSPVHPSHQLSALT